MAEVLVTECVSKTNYIHEIYCDKCNSHIIDAVEASDGWYDDPSEYEQCICINSQWYHFRAQLCDVCKQKMDNEIISKLAELGFKKGM